MNRDRTEDKYKWNLSLIYSSNEDWEIDYKNIEKEIEEFNKFQGKISENSNVLLEALQLSEKIYRGVTKLYAFSSLKLDEDTRISENQSRKDKAFGLYVKANSELSFFTPEILKNRKRIEGFLKEDSNLNIYKHYFERIFRMEDHTLNSEMEELLARVSELANIPSNVFGMLDNADMKFDKVEDSSGNLHDLTHGSYTLLLESKDRKLRENAFKTLYGKYKSLENTFATILDGELKKNKFYADVRKYPNALEAALYGNNIDPIVYKNLIESIHENLENFYKYMNVIKKSLGLEELMMYDIYTNIVDSLDIKIEYPKAVDLIKEALKPMGEYYANILDEGFSQGWIDVYENEGKRSGGYSGGSYDTNPYILMNYKDNLSSVFTLVHELGHSIHSYLSRKNQPFIYGSYSIFVAEVASTVNEVILINYLLENSKTTEEEKYYLNYYLNSFRATVFRQTMFAEFEMLINQQLENKGGVTVDYLNKTYYDLNKTYFGENVTIDREIESEWSRIPHFYYNFYVYQYATGFSAAVYIADKILSNEEGFLDKYINFLSTGGSKYPLDALADIGLDMRKKDVVDRAMEIFEKNLNRLDQII